MPGYAFLSGNPLPTGPFLIGLVGRPGQPGTFSRWGTRASDRPCLSAKLSLAMLATDQEARHNTSRQLTQPPKLPAAIRRDDPGNVQGHVQARYGSLPTGSGGRLGRAAAAQRCRFDRLEEGGVHISPEHDEELGKAGMSPRIHHYPW